MRSVTARGEPLHTRRGRVGWPLRRRRGDFGASHNGAVDVTILRIAAADPDVTEAAAEFDEYRCHDGHPPAFGATRTWLVEQLTCQRIAVAAALDSAGRYMGLITTTAMPASLTLGTAWSIRDLYVVPEHRRRGIASRLIHHVVNDARNVGALRLSLQTEPDNAAALPLYAAAGFQPVEALAVLNLTLVS